MHTESVAASLEATLQTETDLDRRAKVYAALTLATVLSATWTHYVPVHEGKTVKHVFIDKPAGKTVGDRAILEARLTQLLDEIQ
jgi:hypothetical protein